MVDATSPQEVLLIKSVTFVKLYMEVQILILYAFQSHLHSGFRSVWHRRHESLPSAAEHHVNEDIRQELHVSSGAQCVHALREESPDSRINTREM